MTGATPWNGLYLVVAGKAFFVPPETLADWIAYDPKNRTLEEGLTATRVMMKIDMLMADLWSEARR